MLLFLLLLLLSWLLLLLCLCYAYYAYAYAYYYYHYHRHHHYYHHHHHYYIIIIDIIDIIIIIIKSLSSSLSSYHCHYYYVSISVHRLYPLYRIKYAMNICFDKFWTKTSLELANIYNSRPCQAFLDISAITLKVISRELVGYSEWYHLWPLLLTWFNFNPSMDK